MISLITNIKFNSLIIFAKRNDTAFLLPPLTPPTHSLFSLTLSSRSRVSIQQQRPFPYQAHSFNDLNIARRFLLKKVKYFKFDASLASRESC